MSAVEVALADVKHLETGLVKQVTALEEEVEAIEEVPRCIHRGTSQRRETGRTKDLLDGVVRHIEHRSMAHCYRGRVDRNGGRCMEHAAAEAIGEDAQVVKGKLAGEVKYLLALHQTQQ